MRTVCLVLLMGGLQQSRRRCDSERRECWRKMVRPAGTNLWVGNSSEFELSLDLHVAGAGAISDVLAMACVRCTGEARSCGCAMAITLHNSTRGRIDTLATVFAVPMSRRDRRLIETATMLVPAVVVERCDILPCRDGRPSRQRRMGPVRVIEGLEVTQFLFPSQTRTRTASDPRILVAVCRSVVRQTDATAAHTGHSSPRSPAVPAG